MGEKRGIRCFMLTDFSVNQIVQNHENAKLDYYGGNVPKKKFSKQSAIEQRKLNYSILIHTVIKWCERSEDCVATLYSKYLKDKYGNDYVVMLHNLEMLGILDIDHNYIQDNHSKSYSIKNGINYHIGYVMDKKMRDELKTYELKMSQQRREMKNDLIESKLTRKVAKRYEKSLKCIRLNQPDLAEQYVTKYRYPSESARMSRLKKIQDLILLKGNFTIDEIDDNDRIYHVLTNCSRDLKPFINIKFACDCHNSHPLLFNLNILTYYGLDHKTTEKMYEVIGADDTIDICNIKQKLEDRGMSKQSIKGVPADALHYIYLTSRGKFWDYMLDCYGAVHSQYEGIIVTRSDIKLQMFAQVFYRKKLNNTTDKETGEKRYPLAALFQDKFPNVSKIIRNEKMKDSDPNNRKELPSNMMKFESQIYHEILAEIYKLNPKYKVFNIHDAIEVLDVPDNKSLTVDMVKEVMQQVYRRNHLMPDLSVDYQESTDKILSDLQKMNLLIDCKLEELRLSADAGDERANLYLYAIDTGYLEFIWADKKQESVALHITDKIKNEEKTSQKNNIQHNKKQEVTTTCGKKLFHIMRRFSNRMIMTMRGWLDYVNGMKPNRYDLLDNYVQEYELTRGNGKEKSRYSYRIEVKDNNQVTTYVGRRRRRLGVIEKIRNWEG